MFDRPYRATGHFEHGPSPARCRRQGRTTSRRSPRCRSFPGCSPRARWPTPIATCRAASTTPSRRGSKPSCYRIIEKYAANEDPAFRTRAIAIKEERAELVKHHLDVLWHDYFKPEHLEEVPNLHELFWHANKQVSKVKASTDLADAKKLLELIDEVDAAWKATGGEGRRGWPAGPADDVRDDRRGAPSGDGASARPGPQAARGLAARLAGPWRVAVVEGSMEPRSVR